MKFQTWVSRRVLSVCWLSLHALRRPCTNNQLTIWEGLLGPCTECRSRILLQNFRLVSGFMMFPLVFSSLVYCFIDVHCLLFGTNRYCLNLGWYGHYQGLLWIERNCFRWYPVWMWIWQFLVRRGFTSVWIPVSAVFRWFSAILTMIICFGLCPPFVLYMHKEELAASVV